MLKTIAAALGLSETATEAEICAAITARAQAHTDASAQTLAIAAALGLKPEAKNEEIVAAAASAKAGGAPDPAKFVPIAAFTELAGQVKALSEGQSKDKAETVVAAAIAAGKVSPGMKGWADDYAQKDLAGFEAYVAAAAVIVKPGARPGEAPAAAADVLSEEDEAVCASMGWDRAKFLETRKSEKTQ